MSFTLTNYLKDKQNRNYLRVNLPFSFLILFVITRYIGFFQITIYPTVNRATISILFQDYVTLSLLIDHIIIIALGLTTLYFLIQNKKTIPVLAAFLALGVFFAFQYQVGLDIYALLVMPAILTIITYNHFARKKIINKPQNWKNLLYTTTAILFCFELLVLISWITFPFVPGPVKQSFFWHPVSLEFELFYALARLSPVVLILTSYSFLAKPVKHAIVRFLVSKGKKFREVEFSPNVVFNPKIMLSIAVAISVVFAIYPYLPTINPQYTWMSVDDFTYQQFIKEIQRQETIQGMVKQTLVTAHGDRPLTLLAIHSFQTLLGLELVTAIRFFPVLLGPGLVLAVYFFVKEGIKNKQQASYAALLTAFSHQVIVGIYAGFLANWLGLIAAYLCLMVVHRFWEKPSVKNYLLVFGHSILSFLLYIYVDIYLLLTILIFLIITAVKYRNDSTEKRKILILSTIFAIYAAVFVIRILLGSTELYEDVFERKDIELSIREFQNRWSNLPYFMHFYVGGFLANTALLVFAFVWALYSRYEKTFDRILLAALFAGAVPLVFGDEVLQSRIFYDMPVHIVAAIIILRLLNSKDINPFFAKTAFALVTVHFTIYAIRSLSNLNLSGV